MAFGNSREVERAGCAILWEEKLPTLSTGSKAYW